MDPSVFKRSLTGKAASSSPPGRTPVPIRNGRASKRQRLLVSAASTTAVSVPKSPTPAVPPLKSPNTLSRARESLDRGIMFEGDFDKFQMERGYCSIGGVEKYTPQLVRDKLFEQPNAWTQVVGRSLEITFRLGSFLAAWSLDKVLGRANNPEFVRIRASQLREVLTDLGPSFIKAGQVLASRPDIVREDYMNELCTLQDDVPSFSDELSKQQKGTLCLSSNIWYCKRHSATAFAIMEDDLGRPLEEVFSSISERPIAAASLGQVYKAVLRETGEQVAVKVQRPGVEPVIVRDLFIFRIIAKYINSLARQRLGCNAELIVDEFGEKLMEELDYQQEARNIADFHRNFLNDPKVKIPWVRRDLCGSRVLVMEWIDGVRCTDPAAIRASGLDLREFIRSGVVTGLRQLLEFGLFHGDPHPGNIFALRDGRIAYVDFGNVAELSQRNKQTLIDAVVHAVNEDYRGMADDFVQLGFLAPGTDVAPIVPALEKIWADSMVQSMANFNFRLVTSKFNELVYEYPVRIPERYALVIRSLLTQEGICLTLDPSFKFLEVAYPYVAKRLLTDEDPALRERLFQVLFQDGKFQWKRLENLIGLAKEGSGGLDLSDTVRDGAKVLLLDDKLRRQLLLALTEDNRLHVEEVQQLLALVQEDINPQRIVQQTLLDLPSITRQVMLGWSDKVLSS